MSSNKNPTEDKKDSTNLNEIDKEDSSNVFKLGKLVSNVTKLVETTGQQGY